MKYIVIIFFLPMLTQADEYPSCDVHEETTLNSNTPIDVIEVNIQGTPCYEAMLSIKVKNSEEVILYLYSSNFKKHTSVPWDAPDLDEVASLFAKSVLNKKHIKSCFELSPAEQGIEWAFNYQELKVPNEIYTNYKNTDCKFYTHPIHYEAWRNVVFPSNSNTGIIVSEYGL